MAGIVEIAKKAGVSPATVSRALRGIHHVNENTRRKIVDAARELDYPIRPDLLPRGTHEKTNTIGVIAPFISRWYFSQSISGVEQALREAGHQLHVVTNGVREPQRRKIAALGLSDFIEELVTSDVARSYKPDPEIFHYALRSTGAQAGESWMIGDSVLRDVLGGQAVGMRTAWFRADDALPPDAEATPELEFRDWREFPGQLEAAIRG